MSVVTDPTSASTSAEASTGPAANTRQQTAARKEKIALLRAQLAALELENSELEGDSKNDEETPQQDEDLKDLTKAHQGQGGVIKTETDVEPQKLASSSSVPPPAVSTPAVHQPAPRPQAVDWQPAKAPKLLAPSFDGTAAKLTQYEKDLKRYRSYFPEERWNEILSLTLVGSAADWFASGSDKAIVNMSKLSVLEIQTVLDKYAEVSGLSESEIAKAIWAAMSSEVYQFARMENISKDLPPSELMASLWAVQEWESRKVTAAPPQPQPQPSYKAPFYGQRAAQPKQQPSQPQKQQTSVVAAVAFAEAMAAKYNLSAEELERRRREHLCFRCGSGTHLRKTCGQAPAVAAVQVPMIKLRTVTKEEMKVREGVALRVTLAGRQLWVQAMILDGPVVPLLLGMDVLAAANPVIDLATRTVRFESMKPVVLPEAYAEFADRFEPSGPKKLPVSRPGFDAVIRIDPSKQLRCDPNRKFGRSKEEALRKYVEDGLKTGMIVESESAFCSQPMFVKKGDGWRVCMDSRRLNEATIRDRYPSPDALALIDKLKGAKIFSKFDLTSAFWQVRLSADRYFDDIIVFSKTPEEHELHVKQMLARLREFDLYVSLKKCVFGTSSVDFLGRRVSEAGVAVDPRKVQAVLNWKPPTDATGVREVNGLASFMRRHVPNYAELARPMTMLTRKNVPFVWSAECEKSFRAIQQALVQAPVLAYPDTSRPFEIFSDASDLALGGVLMQRSESGDGLHPVAYYSRVFTKPEINYSVYDKELLAILECLREWRHYVCGSGKITVWSDHRNLQWFTETRELTAREARWCEMLGEFDLVIKHLEGSKNGAADAMSRSASGAGPKEKLKGRVLDPELLVAPVAGEADDEQSEDFVFSPGATLPSAPTVMTPTAIREALQKAVAEGEEEGVELLSSKRYQLHDGLIKREDRVFVPEHLRPQILRYRHDAATARHCGNRKTLEDYSQGFNAVMVCIDRLTRVAHFIPTTKSVTAEESAQLFLENVVKLHGVPVRVLSDHGPQFIAKFWKKLWKAMDIDLSYSSAYHPQGNGLVERVNQALESYLRAYVGEAEDWSRLLWLCEFTYNNTVHAAIQCSPFMAMYGFQPEMDEINFKSPKAPQTAADRVEELKALRFSLRANIHRANMSAAKFYDRHHKAAPPITVGSLVTVLRRSQTAEQPYAKLAYVRDGPFKVVKQINERAFELDLGEASSKSRTFHVSVLELFVADDVEGRIRRVLPPVKDWDGTVRHRVEAVIDSTRHSEIMYYRIRG
ncbi:hypothetical protein CAOG_08740 [Capsaspora owczarzaki ATCC 30864]|uniref:Integrase catalytic domain-containing protein n=1 Tax=Capsaspora owczarzaki (strain ATCC 30864) TaxID=595528 RepID=A0A0D2X2R2_CAPO3|nr:hypothetical protein CAOG_08740 [Capsaspora owczarzaki ATCC 30864]KJE93004.1 hypothetical protein CAOG_008740 [Capsaspora owczarzaki ATCC 30864]|eukprot:XP_011270360.1 hypothetical protein CAOG_08740 [Capsaspora owczarzaki ATCC 30864]